MALPLSIQMLRNMPKRALMALVQAYRLLLKAWIGSACRFEPTCSAYALEALDLHGAIRGSILSAKRLLRCHPYCQGGHDPVPERTTTPAAGLFTRLLP
jgi:hypothetical protein